MAHITGGGLVDNTPRMLPKGLDAVIDRSTWDVPTIYRFLQEKGKVDADEMYRVFNMGIGYVLAVRKEDIHKTLKALRKQGTQGVVIGFLDKGKGVVRMKN